MSTGFVWHELYMWHDPGPGTGFLPPGYPGQPGRHVEAIEAKRRMKNLIEASGLQSQLVAIEPRDATESELLRAHTPEYVDRIRTLSAERGGDAGMHAGFGHGSFEIATLAAGGVIAATDAVLDGTVDNAYAMVRPIGHHAEPDKGLGFCIFNNGAIAGHHALNVRGLDRIAYVDWDVHHGNGTQRIFYSDPRALTISIHQENWLPPDSGHIEDIGEGDGRGFNINIPLQPGAGNGAYEAAFDRVVIPALRAFKPQLIFLPCGFDAGALDPLARMMLHSDSFRSLTKRLMAVADELCDGLIVGHHEGGYCEMTVPFYGVAVIETLAGVDSGVEDPVVGLMKGMAGQELQPHQDARITEIATKTELLR